MAQVIQHKKKHVVPLADCELVHGRLAGYEG